MEKVDKVDIHNKVLTCMHCGHTEFWQASTLLNKTWLSFLDLEGFSNRGKAYICERCGYKHEFIDKKTGLL